MLADMAFRKRYSSDLSAGDWPRLEPPLRVRRRSKWPLVEVGNAVLYVLKNGCLWRDLPGDFLPWGTGYWYFAKWQREGTLEALTTCLPMGCCPHKPPPTCVLIDTQSVKNAAPATDTTVVSFDAGTRVKGRKCLVLMDTLGNVLASRAVPAHVSDAAAATAFWDEVAATHPLPGQMQVVIGDTSFAGLFAQHDGLRFEKPANIVLKKKNFCLHKKRWLVEHILAWLSNNRRLSKEYDRLLTRPKAWARWANVRRILQFC